MVTRMGRLGETADDSERGDPWGGVRPVEAVRTGHLSVGGEFVELKAGVTRVAFTWLEENAYACPELLDFFDGGGGGLASARSEHRANRLPPRRARGSARRL